MKRVLIVDDAIDLGRLLQDAIKTVHPDIPISVVPSAEEALLESTRFTIDVLVTDIRLPGMTGVDLVRKIRVRQPNIKVIMMTGLRPEDRLFKQKDEVTPDVFLRKPIMTPDFLDAVDQLLGEGKSREQPAPEKPAPVSEQDAINAAVLQELAAVLPGEPVEPAAAPAAAYKATGGLKPPAEPAPAETGLSAVLSRLRGSLGAISAMLLDERGKPVAQAGDLPDMPIEAQFASPMMASLSAGSKISYLLGQTANTPLVQAYRGTTVDLVIAPTGQYVLLLALPTGRAALRLALACEEALYAQTEIMAALDAMGLRVQTAVEAGAPEVIMAEMGATGQLKEEQALAEILETPLGQDPGLEKFEELFKKKKTGELRMQDPDSFWDAVSSDRKEVSQPGVLSFEQAQKLGLFPPEEKE